MKAPLLAVLLYGAAASSVDKFTYLSNGQMKDLSSDKFVYLSNAQIKAGIDLSKGGAIGYLSAANNDLNMINIHDEGREVQLSFYSGPNPYDNCHWSGHGWPWNPIGAGDAFGHSGSILNMTSTDTSIHLFTRPLQWACDNVPCDCVFEQLIELDQDAVVVTATLHNNRVDRTDYGKTAQELPAMYTIGQLSQLTCYTGDLPFTNQPLTNYPTVSGPPWSPGNINCSEHWAAFINPDTQFGVGLFRNDWPIFYTGFHGEHGTGGPTDDPTGYIAGNGCGDGVDFKWNSVYQYEFAVVIGDVSTIRSWAAGRKDTLSHDCGKFLN